MKRVIALLVCAAFVLGGCASGKFLGFLATSDYVDAQTKAVAAQQQATIQQQAAEIQQLKDQVSQLDTIKDQAQKAIDQMDQYQQAITDLQNLAKQAQDQIVAIPKEVVQSIIDALQAVVSK